MYYILLSLWANVAEAEKENSTKKKNENLQKKPKPKVTGIMLKNRT